jgi:hypothetical protein
MVADRFESGRVEVFLMKRATGQHISAVVTRLEISPPSTY